MSTRVDPLRSTLDHLALDPRAASDRPYLITMLRRLGYSEAEIAAYLGEKTTPAPAPEPEPEPTPVREPLPEEGHERLIELEYTGPGLRDFQLVVPVDATEFDIDDPLGLGAGLEAGTETIEGDPDEDELEAFLSGEGAMSIDDEFADDDDLPDDDEEEIATREMGDFGEDDEDDEEGDERVTFNDDGEMETLDASESHPDDEGFDENMDPSNPAGIQPDEAIDPDEHDIHRGVHLVEFKGTTMKPARVRKLSAEEKAALAAQDSLDAALDAGWQVPADAEPMATETNVQAAPVGEEWPEYEEEADTPLGDAFTFGDWILHSREQQRADGTWHRVYFFAKGQSPNGEPSAMPEGYEVGVNERSQLPYLRRSSGEAPATPPAAATENWDDEASPSWDEAAAADEPAPRKRVRMRRVTAENPEDAERMMRDEGHNVLGTMPVDIEEHEDDEP